MTILKVADSHHLEISETGKSGLWNSRKLVVVKDPKTKSFKVIKIITISITKITYSVVSCLLYVKASEDTDVNRLRDRSLKYCSKVMTITIK